MRLIEGAATFRAAFAFLTRLPLGQARSTPVSLAWAPAHFPLVGAALGAAGALTFRALAPLDSGIRGWAVVALLALLTGALHEDGLADTADALGGSFDRAKMFEILKDSRIGTFGAAALVCSLALRAGLLSSLLARSGWTLVASQAASRLAAVVLLGSMPYVTPVASRSRDLANAGLGPVAVALGWTLLVLFATVRLGGVPPRSLAAALGALTLAVLWLAYRFRARAGGITGDFLGATQQVGEIAFLGALAVTPWPPGL